MDGLPRQPEAGTGQCLDRPFQFQLGQRLKKFPDRQPAGSRQVVDEPGLVA